MEPMKLPQQLQNNMVWTSNYCERHSVIKEGVRQVTPYPMLLIDGKELCPRCKTEEWNQELQKQEQQKYDNLVSNRKYNILYSKSVMNDKTILLATFDTYKAFSDEEKKNKRLCLEILKELKDEQVFNVFFQGNPGAGKSHLANSLLVELNKTKEYSCLFINVEEMLRLIRDSFNNKESQYTEKYFIHLLSSVDYLVLDDVGAETGAIETSRTATDFVQRILYAVTNARQDKVTIATTNLDSERLFSMYDKKLISRLWRNPKFILFKETKDKRITGLPF